MTEDDEIEFGKIMLGVAENAGVEISDAGMDMRFEALSSYSINEIRQVALELVKRRAYHTMPTVGEFIDILEGRPSDKAAIEAEYVLNAIKRIGHDRSVVFTDPVTASVISDTFGGWVKLCKDLLADNEKWFIKNFIDSYMIHLRSNVVTVTTLLGTSDIENSAKGYKKWVKNPVVIGKNETQKKITQGEIK